MKLTSAFLHARPSKYAKLIASEHQGCRKGRRTLFTLPSLPSFSPFGDDGGNGSNNEQRYHERKIMPYTRKQLYDLVADVDNYREFLPYCTDSVVHSSRLVEPTQPDGGAKAVEKKRASLTVGFLAFKESYTSEVTCTPYSSVEAIASSGTPLFRKLVTTWRFQPASPSSPHPTQSSVSNPKERNSDKSSSGYEDGSSSPTLLSIDLAFEFSNPIYAGVSAKFFEHVSKMMVNAFEERCLEVYGKGRR